MNPIARATGVFALFAGLGLTVPLIPPVDQAVPYPWAFAAGGAIIGLLFALLLLRNGQPAPDLLTDVAHPPELEVPETDAPEPTPTEEGASASEESAPSSGSLFNDLPEAPAQTPAGYTPSFNSVIFALSDIDPDQKPPRTPEDAPPARTAAPAASPESTAPPAPAQAPTPDAEPVAAGFASLLQDMGATSQNTSAPAPTPAAPAQTVHPDPPRSAPIRSEPTSERHLARVARLSPFGSDTEPAADASPGQFSVEGDDGIDSVDDLSRLFADRPDQPPMPAEAPADLSMPTLDEAPSAYANGLFPSSSRGLHEETVPGTPDSAPDEKSEPVEARHRQGDEPIGAQVWQVWQGHIEPPRGEGDDADGDGSTSAARIRYGIRGTADADAAFIPEPDDAHRKVGILKGIGGRPPQGKAEHIMTTRIDDSSQQQLLMNLVNRQRLPGTSGPEQIGPELSSSDDIRRLYDAYIDAARRCGHAGAGADFATFAQKIRHQRDKIRQKHGIERLEMNIRIDSGTPRIEIRPSTS